LKVKKEEIEVDVKPRFEDNVEFGEFEESKKEEKTEFGAFEEPKKEENVEFGEFEESSNNVE